MTTRKIINTHAGDMRRRLDDIRQLADHGVPYFLYCDNTAACEFANRLREIEIIARFSLRNENPTDETI